MNRQSRESGLIATMVLLLAGLFLFDIYTPMNFADHALYVIVILLAMASRSSWVLPTAAGAGTVLTVLGGVGTPWFPDLPRWIQIGNRTITITILWILVWFGWKRREAERALQKANEELERKVLERTHELGSVNQTLITEIAERIETEQALRLSQGRLAGILDIAEDAIIVTENDRSITLFNQGAVKLFGYNPDQVLGQRIDRLLSERFVTDASDAVYLFDRASDSARHVERRCEVLGIKHNGRTFPAEASISKLTVDERTTYIVIVRDISDRLMTERQLQSLATRLMVAQEEERRRIARELHDDINQRLALLAIQMGKAEADLAIKNTQVGELMQSLTQRLAVISDDVRRMAYQFHPSILEDLGLTTALKQLTDEWALKTGIRIVIVQEERADSVARDIASCLYRVAQESLANIIKHASASRVELELTCDGQEVTLSIYDTGVGFDLNAIRTRHSGLGLVNMRERVRSVGGHFEIRSEPGHGTQVTVRIPLSGATHEQTTNSFS